MISDLGSNSHTVVGRLVVAPGAYLVLGKTTWPDPSGASLQLEPTGVDGGSNDDGAHGCTAVTPLASGDPGTPGTANDGC